MNDSKAEAGLGSLYLQVASSNAARPVFEARLSWPFTLGRVTCAPRWLFYFAG